jgi:hypothetical protein
MMPIIVRKMTEGFVLLLLGVLLLLSRLVILRYDLDAARAVGYVTSPVLVFHSRDDEIMPFELGRNDGETRGLGNACVR